MSKKWIAALVIGGSLVCAAGLIGFIVLVKTVAERRAAARARADEERARVFAAERDAGRAEAAAVFAAPTRPAPAEESEFAAVFNGLGRALERGDVAAVNRAFDGDRMIQELDQIGVFARAPGNDRAGLRAGMRKGIDEKFGSMLVANEMARWARTEVRHVRWSSDRREAMIIGVHRSGDGDELPLRFRWWLVSRPGGWRVYDFEDMQVGLRATRLISALVTPEMIERIGRNPLAFQTAMAGIRDAIALAAKGDFEGAATALAPARPGPWPPEVRAIIELVEGMILVGRGDHGGALARFDTAEQLVPGMPSNALGRGSALVALGQFDAALVALRAYQKEIGPDALSCTLEGTVLENQGKSAEAAGAYGRALDEVAESADAFNGLRRTLPNGQKKELGDRLARTSDPQKFYTEAAGAARRDGDTAALDALLDGLRKARPNDPLGLADDIRRKVLDKQFAAAAELMRDGLKARTRADRETVMGAYLLAMRGANKPLDGYAAVSIEHAARAFRALAGDLEDDLFEGDDKPAAREHLTALIAAHRKRAATDPWLWFYEGALHQHAQDYEAAGTAFTAGAAKLPDRPDPTDPDAIERDGELFRSRRVVCLFEQKKGPDAYRDVGPPNATFGQLAGLYDTAKDFEGLGALIKAHRNSGVRDSERPFWEARLLYRTNEYVRAGRAYRKYLNESDERAPSRWSARDELIRSALRTEPADAAKTVREFGPDGVSRSLRAAVAAANGNRDELERLLAESAKNGAKSWFYSDEDFRQFIYQGHYRDLREKYPDPNPPKVGG